MASVISTGFNKISTVRMVTYVPVAGSTFGDRLEIEASVSSGQGPLGKLVEKFQKGELSGIVQGVSPGATTVYVDNKALYSVKQGDPPPIEIAELAQEIQRAAWPSLAAR